MSNRFHSKYHRTNHHTDKSSTNPDSGYDPIASPEHPFKGKFCLNGALIIKNKTTTVIDGSINVLSASNIINLSGTSSMTLNTILNAEDDIIYFLTNVSNYNLNIGSSGNIYVRSTTIPLVLPQKTTCCFKKIPFENKISLW